MTQHMLIEDVQHDIETMRNLRRFIGVFMALSILMALGVALLAP